MISPQICYKNEILTISNVTSQSNSQDLLNSNNIPVDQSLLTEINILNSEIKIDLPALKNIKKISFIHSTPPILDLFSNFSLEFLQIKEKNVYQKTLKITNNSLFSDSSIGAFISLPKNLISAEIYMNNCTSELDLSSNISLKNLTISQSKTEITQFPSNLTNLSVKKSQKSLNLSDNLLLQTLETDDVHDFQFDFLSKSLQKITISHCKFTQCELDFRQFKQLKSLDLSFVDVSREIILSDSITSLKLFQITTSGIFVNTDALVEFSHQNVQNITVYSASETQQANQQAANKHENESIEAQNTTENIKTNDFNSQNMQNLTLTDQTLNMLFCNDPLTSLLIKKCTISQIIFNQNLLQLNIQYCKLPNLTTPSTLTELIIYESEIPNLTITANIEYFDVQFSDISEINLPGKIDFLKYFQNKIDFPLLKFDLSKCEIQQLELVNCVVVLPQKLVNLSLVSCHCDVDLRRQKQLKTSSFCDFTGTVIVQNELSVVAVRQSILYERCPLHKLVVRESGMVRGKECGKLKVIVEQNGVE